MITEGAGALPASHGVVSVQHLLAQLAVLDPAGELDVSELVPQQLWPQEALQVSSKINKQHNNTRPIMFLACLSFTSSRFLILISL